ncbi:MAG TPA: hypothetical protein VFA74_19615 [Terriglobales bacterium]|nr:hypothetical protein [Terriglobales bacterium]
MQNIQHLRPYSSRFGPDFTRFPDTYAGNAKIVVKPPLARDSSEAHHSMDNIKYESVAQFPYPTSYNGGRDKSKRRGPSGRAFFIESNTLFDEIDHLESFRFIVGKQEFVPLIQLTP